MAITIAEAQERRLEATRVACESSILRQWYYSLGMALAEQAATGLPELDFSAHWIMCPSELLGYLREGGVPATLEDWHEVVIAFIEEQIGDQLEEYGVEVRLKPVANGLSGSNRFYLLRPGEEPTYN